MPSVTIVDDSEMLRELFADYLEQVGFEVLGVFGTVSDAVESIAARRPDIALVDYHLGRQLGTEIFSCGQKQGRPAVLYLSGTPLAQTLTAESGEAFIQKPVSLADLALALNAVWHVRTSGTSQGVEVPAGLRWLSGGTAFARRSSALG